MIPSKIPIPKDLGGIAVIAVIARDRRDRKSKKLLRVFRVANCHLPIANCFVFKDLPVVRLGGRVYWFLWASC